MTEITVRFLTDQHRIDPSFYESLHSLAQQYGMNVEEEPNADSVRFVREGRDWLDRRDMERAIHSHGLRKDFSHLDKVKG